MAGQADDEGGKLYRYLMKHDPALFKARLRSLAAEEEDLADDVAAQQKDQELFMKIVERHPEVVEHVRQTNPEATDHQPGPRGEVPVAEGAAEEPKKERKSEDQVDAKCAAVAVIVLLVAVCVAVASLVVFDLVKHRGLDSDGGGGDDTPSNGSPGSVTGPYRTAITYPVNYSDPIYSATDYTAVCVYQATSQGLLVNGSEYGVPIFPYPYCHVAVYCCLSVDAQDAIVPRPDTMVSHQAFSTAVKQNPVIKTLAIVGGLPDDGKRFQELLDKPDALDAFAKNAKMWCDQYSFDGIYLHWSNPPMGNRAKLTEAVRSLSRELESSGRVLGLLLPQDRQKQAAFDLAGLTSVLGRASILLLPPPAKGSWQFNDYYNPFTVAILARRENWSAPGKICALLPAGAFTMITDKSTNARQGPGRPGPFTKTAGRLSYFETCNAVPSCRLRKEELRMIARCGDTLLSYATPDTVREFVCRLQQDVKLGCFGLWRSDWDDFAGSCGTGHFPLTRALLRRKQCAKVG